MKEHRDILHQPVLLQEAINALKIDANGMYVDGTFGLGGHASAILKELGEGGRLFAFDQDASVKKYLIDDPRFEFWQINFADIKTWAEQHGLMNKINGILLDLGVSSPQLDEAGRGFSFLRDGPLDMRMNPSQGISASEWLQRVNERELKAILREYGEEKFAGRIARAIVEHGVFTSTTQLASLVERVAPKREKHKHPATRTFQAIRIYINDELNMLRRFLAGAVDVLAPGGRLAIISFHSLEDRIVKQFIREKEKGAPLPREIPVLHTYFRPLLRSIGKAIKPQSEEVLGNQRARSAILRIAEKCHA